MPRCWTLATATIDGSASSSRYEHHGRSVSWTMSIVRRCSSWSFVDATSASRDAGIDDGITAAGCGAGKRVRSHDVAGPRDQQLGARADHPVDGEHEARRERGAEPCEHADDVDRFGHLDHDLAREHDLVERTRADAIARRCDGGLPLARRTARREAHVGRPARAGRRSTRFDGILDRITLDAPGKAKTVLSRKGEDRTIANRKDEQANADEARRLIETLQNEQVANFADDVASDLAKYGSINRSCN